MSDSRFTITDSGPLSDGRVVYYVNERSAFGTWVRRSWHMTRAEADAEFARLDEADEEAFEAHRAADPHCTCNDCTTHHFGSVPER